MPTDIFRRRDPRVPENPALRVPQREAYQELATYAAGGGADREVGVVLPVGCGKSGLITITPFAFQARRVLVVAPNVKIAEQLKNDFDPTRPEAFYLRCRILDGAPYPELAEIRGRATNRGDLDEADVIVTNIQQLQGDQNRWLETLPPDFFDLIAFDEAHHNVAESWQLLRDKFPEARIVNFSATPVRADGRPMAGRIVYSYPVAEAIRQGYVKRLKALVLNPTTLRFIRREGDREIEVPLEEVVRLGEDDADFRRAIVTSAETLTTIVDASIRELDRLRAETGEGRLKIIASALNYQHCIQIVEAYRARGRRADYVHSRQDGAINRRVLDRLANHELDVIVQVRQLGEGFDHPYLSVAAVLSIFKELSPFVQFVGRIMRVIVPNDPNNRLNQGIVVFHAGANIARRWDDFRQFSEADREFFDQLLPMEGLGFDRADEIEVVPMAAPRDEMEVLAAGPVLVAEIPLLAQDDVARRAFEVLRKRGFTPDDYRRAVELQPVPTTRQRERQAARSGLDDRVRNTVGRVLGDRRVNPEGRDLDRQRRNRSNFVVLKSAIDRRIAAFAGRATGERDEFSREQLERIDEALDRLVAEAAEEVFGG